MLGLSEQERSERATHAAEARWAREELLEFDWQGMPLDRAQNMLVKLSGILEVGRSIVQQRVGDAKAQDVKCEICERPIRERWVSKYDLRNGQGVIIPYYLCSPICDTRFQTKRRGGTIK